MEMVPPRPSALQSLKQPAGASRCNYLPLGRHHCRPPQAPRFCPVDDGSTTAEGWLKKSNFSELGESPVQVSVRIEAAQTQASLFIPLGLKFYSQWFKGKANEVSDALSRNDDRSDDELTKIIKTFCPFQVPSRFEIHRLPNKITSWLTVFLLKLPVSKQLKEAHMRSKLGRGSAGKNILSLLESKMMTTLRTSRESTSTPSLVPLPWLSEKQDFQS
jgi:hypothetical protein